MFVDTGPFSERTRIQTDLVHTCTRMCATDCATTQGRSDHSNCECPQLVTAFELSCNCYRFFNSASVDDCSGIQRMPARKSCPSAGGTLPCLQAVYRTRQHPLWSTCHPTYCPARPPAALPHTRLVFQLHFHLLFLCSLIPHALACPPKLFTQVIVLLHIFSFFTYSGW